MPNLLKPYKILLTKMVVFNRQLFCYFISIVVGVRDARTANAVIYVNLPISRKFVDKSSLYVSLLDSISPIKIGSTLLENGKDKYKFRLKLFVY